jgi:hypothetical protein
VIRRLALVAAIACSVSSAMAWGTAPVPPWMRDAAHAPLPSFPDSPGGICLLDVTKIVVSSSDSITLTHRRVYKIMTTEGRDLAYAHVFYDGQTQITSMHAWAITAKDEEYALKESDAVETSAGDGMLYADDKIKIIKIPAADPGSVVAFEYEQRYRPYNLQSSWYYQGEQPVARSRFELQLPAGWTHSEKWYNGPAAVPVVSGNSIAWEKTAVSAIKEEVAMPSWKAVVGRMAINFQPPVTSGSGQQSWNDLGNWYGRLAGPRRVATPRLQARTRELTAGKSEVLDRIRALTAFAQNDVRYVAIEIGVGGYQPHAADEIFANRYGDCKDKVTVLATMLQDAGIESYYLLVHTSRDYVDPDFPSIGSFNHVISAIRLPANVTVTPGYSVIDHPRLGKLLLFDPTNTTTPVGYLPSYLQDSKGLLVTAGGGELIDLPVHPSSANQLHIAATMNLDADGTLDGEVVETRSGWMAAGWRSHLETLNLSERTKYIEKRLAESMAQQNLRDLTVENIDDLSKDLVIRYKVTAHGYVKHAGGMMLVRPRMVGYATRGLDLKERKYAYETDGPYVETDDVTITVPANVSVDELPQAQKLVNPALNYTSSSTFEKGTLHYSRRLEMTGFRVPLARLAELNKVFGAISADERSSVVLK